MNTSAFAVKGNRRRASSAADTGLVPQSIAGTHTTFVLPIAPEPVRAVALTRTHYGTNIDFLGATRPCATRESRHDAQMSLGLEAPPPYPDATLAAYPAGANTEPVTLAMYLFKLGFLFPPFWILGAVIVTCPLTVPADFEPSKSGAEREQLARNVRNTELKWAQRCAWALVALLVLAGFAIAITVGVLRS